MILIGTVPGEEKGLGTFTESFLVAPGQTHTSKVEIVPEAALAGQTVESLTIFTYLHGAALGHGIVELRTQRRS